MSDLLDPPPPPVGLTDMEPPPVGLAERWDHDEDELLVPDDLTVDDLEPDDVSWPDAPHPAGGDRPSSDPGALTPLLEALKVVDAAMASAVHLVRTARLSGESIRRTGMLLERHASLAAGWTAADTRFLLRAEQTLHRMPAIDAAFADGQLSWGQVRGIITAVKPLRVGQLPDIDTALANEVGQGEPDRIIEQAYTHVDHTLADADPIEPAKDPAEHRRLGFQPDLFGGARLFGYDTIEAITTIIEAANAAADPPQADHPQIDADVNPTPPALSGTTRRQAQLAEGLYRIAKQYLSGGPDDTSSGRRSRPDLQVVVDLTRFDKPLAQLLARWHGRLITLTPLTTERLLCDATVTATFSDGARPVAIGDSTAPITRKHRQALYAWTRAAGCPAARPRRSTPTPTTPSPARTADPPAPTTSACSAAPATSGSTTEAGSSRWTHIPGP